MRLATISCRSLVFAAGNASKLNNPAAERDGTHSIAQPLSGIISSPQGFGHRYRIGERAGNVRPPWPGGEMMRGWRRYFWPGPGVSRSGTLVSGYSRLPSFFPSVVHHLQVSRLEKRGYVAPSLPISGGSIYRSSDVTPTCPVQPAQPSSVRREGVFAFLCLSYSCLSGFAFWGLPPVDRILPSLSPATHGLWE